MAPEQWLAQADLFNAIRDVIFREDDVKTRINNPGHILASLCTLAMGPLRKANLKNLRAALDGFADNSKLFKDLERVDFYEKAMRVSALSSAGRYKTRTPGCAER